MCDRLVPMPHPRFVPVLLAGAAILFAVTPGRAQGPTPAAPSTTSSGTADTPVPARVRVSDVDFTGVSPSILSELRTTLSMRPSSRWPWGRKVYFSRARLADDLRRIEVYYDEHGFADARVDSYDVQMPSPKEVAITFHVVEGLPVHIASVQTFGLEVLPETVRARLVTYHRQTAPVIDYYRLINLLITVPGSGPVESVQRATLAAVRSRVH